MNKDLTNKINLLIRSEKALLKLEMRRKGRQIVMVSVAVLAILAALVMLNVAAYFYLLESQSPFHAALILSGSDLVLAILLLILASRQMLGSEAETVNEVRNYALEELSDDFDEIRQEALEIKNGFSRVSSGISSVLNRDFSALKSILPIVEMIFESRKKNKE
ncbi:MAG: phage holin family protein [Thiovulaceae bacterium]|nr:phage holin family protein [Sulfurimonadaceae bacterium]